MLTVIVDGFFGDTGKGKVAAYLALADRPALCVRTGAPNAGHTIHWQGAQRVMRSLPTCFVNPATQLAVAPGALIRLDVFLVEAEAAGRERSKVDFQTGVIEPRHVEAERADRHLMASVGSTGQGVGPAMADRALRRLRLARDFPELQPFLADVPAMVHERRGEGVLVEGTQGTFLSLYHGTYPYVTSRDTTASGILSEVGVGPRDVDEVVLVFKAYVTRVGNGPLPGELPPEEAERRGWLERGSVTGRPRRAATFSLELARRAVMLNGPTQLAVTKLDALFAGAAGRRRWQDLPPEARRWVEGLEEALKVPVTLIGTGPGVEDMVDLRRERRGP